MTILTPFKNGNSGLKAQVREYAMAAHPLRPGSGASPEWQSTFSSRTHSQLVACIRAGLIALGLLVVLVLIVLM
ncbi:hypothetical protein FZI93_00885 [Mycobacterium sp. CBMA361]|nr:hypothetical protein [Mycolicibacterium sp. CBMA 361]